MAWQEIAFTLPVALDNVAIDASAIISNIVSDAESAEARLASADKPEYTKNALADTAEDIIYSIDELTDKDIALVVIHPWLNGYYQEGPIKSFLSARNAIKACSRKLSDMFDINVTPGSVEVLVIVFSAANYKDLFEALTAFNAVFYVPELSMLARRCEQVSNHENRKMIIPESPVYPLLVKRNTQQFQTVSHAMDLLNGQMSLVIAYADQNITPSEELENLIAEKKEYVEAMQERYEDFSNMFSGGAGSVLFLSASSPFNNSNLLNQHSETLPEKPLAVSVMMTGESGSLTLIKNMVGL